MGESGRGDLPPKQRNQSKVAGPAQLFSELEISSAIIVTVVWLALINSSHECPLLWHGLLSTYIITYCTFLKCVSYNGNPGITRLFLTQVLLVATAWMTGVFMHTNVVWFLCVCFVTCWPCLKLPIILDNGISPVLKVKCDMQCFTYAFACSSEGQCMSLSFFQYYVQFKRTSAECLLPKYNEL